MDYDDPAEKRPGRTGNDGIAFRIGKDDTITDILALEAKCLAIHNGTKVGDAHKKLSAEGKRPSGIRELIHLFSEYDTVEARTWHAALLQVWSKGSRTVRRSDGFAYACGTRPPAKRGLAWMAPGEPHPAYVVSRNLECMEFQFDDLPALIETLFRGG